MFKRVVLSMAFSLFISCAQATVFFPLPFEKQVEEATSGVEVHLASSKVFKNSIGTIMTEYSFDVLEAYNLVEGDLENEKLKLTMPGGTFNGVTSMIDGAPQFNAEEKAFLLLKKVESKIYLSNFTLGKFKVSEEEGKIFYVSDVFPTDPNVGRISKDKMVELMKNKWKISFFDSEDKFSKPSGEIAPKAISALFKEQEKRQPAQEEELTHEIPVFFWSSLAVLIFFFTLIFFKLGKSELQHKKE